MARDEGGRVGGLGSHPLAGKDFRRSLGIWDDADAGDHAVAMGMGHDLGVEVAIRTASEVGARGPGRYMERAGDDGRAVVASAGEPWRASPGTRLWRWQRDALDAWKDHGHVGVVQAVTGTGKTMVGVVAIAQALRTGRRCVVLVPSDHLVTQWLATLRRYLPNAVLAAKREAREGWDVRVTTVQTAMNQNFLMRREAGMVVADECHRYGAPSYSMALRTGYDWRLGLSATAEREDDGDAILRGYFHGVCFDLGYRRATRDHLIAPYDVALVGVPLEASERAEYERLSEEMRLKARQLKDMAGVAAEPFSLFMAQVGELARERSSAWHGLASAYLARFAARKDLLARTTMKQKALQILAPVVHRSHGSLIFTQTKESAQESAAMLARQGIYASAVHSGQTLGEREERMFEFAAGATRALSAPRVLDEGVDVPGADLGVVVASNRSRRQMIQRMGRVLRLKRDDGPARFVVMYAIDTVEDPHHFGEMPAFFKECLPWARNWDEFDLRLPGESVRLLEFLGVSEQRPVWESERERLIGADRDRDDSDGEGPVGEVSGGGTARPGASEEGGDRGTTSAQARVPGRPERSGDAASPQPVGENEPTVTVPVDTVSLGRGPVDATGNGGAGEDDGFQLSDLDESDGPAAQIARAGASADPVKDYLRQIGQFTLLTAAEEIALSRRIEAGVYAEHLLEAGRWSVQASSAELERLADEGRAAKEQFIVSNLRLVVSLAKRYTGRGMEFLDLIQEGNLGLIRAIEKFDWKKGSKFSTYGTWWIKQAITRAMADLGSTIRIPVHLTEKMNTARRWLHGRGLDLIAAIPQCPEGIPELEITHDELVRMARLARPLVSIESIYELVSDSVPMSPIHGDGPVVPGEGSDPNLPFVWDAMNRLEFEDLRTTRILMQRFGFETGEPETLDVIGQSLGVTRERVRQLEKSGLERVRAILREGAAGQELPENRPTLAVPPPNPDRKGHGHSKETSRRHSSR